MSDIAIKVDRVCAVPGGRAVPGVDAFDIWLIALVMTSYLIVGALPFKAKKFGDGIIYNEAKVIAQALHGAKDWHEINISRAPGPVLFYAIPYAVMPAASNDNSYWLAGLIWTIGWITFSLLLLRRAATYLGDALTGRVAAVIAVLIPFSVYYSFGVWGESMAYIGSVVTCYAWAKWRVRSLAEDSRTSLGSIALLAFGLVLIILARPNAILILGIGGLAALTMLPKRKTRAQAKFALAAIVLAGLASFACLRLVSLLSHGGQENNLALVLFQGRFQYRTEPFDWRYWGQEYRAGSTDYALFMHEQDALKERSRKEGVALDTLKREWAIDDWSEHPAISLQQAAVRLATLNLLVVNSKPPDAFQMSIIPGKVVYLLFHTVVNGLYVLVLLASLFFLFTRRGSIASHWVMWGPYLALLIFHAATYGEPRYMFPALPGLTLMAGMAVAPALETITTKFSAIRGRRADLSRADLLASDI